MRHDFRLMRTFIAALFLAFSLICFLGHGAFGRDD